MPIVRFTGSVHPLINNRGRFFYDPSSQAFLSKEQAGAAEGVGNQGDCGGFGAEFAAGEPEGGVGDGQAEEGAAGGGSGADVEDAGDHHQIPDPVNQGAGGDGIGPVGRKGEENAYHRTAEQQKKDAGKGEFSHGGQVHQSKQQRRQDDGHLFLPAAFQQTHDVAPEEHLFRKTRISAQSVPRPAPAAPLP